MGELVAVDVVEVETLEERVARLDKELNRVRREVAAIRRVQRENMPIFKGALERIDIMRKSLHDHANSLTRLEALAGKAVAAQEIAAASTAELVALLNGTKTAFGVARKYWPRLATFALGIAVTKGWITAENGTNFLSIFS